MKMAGFTHGCFYNHFASNDDLVAEAFAQAFAPAVKDAEAIADGIESILEAFELRIPGSPKEKRRAAINTMASLIGAVLLSRGIGNANDKLSKEILTAARSKMRTKGPSKKGVK
jgi:AcrR family transcriptional regulator